MVMKSLRDRIRNRFEVSAAEVGSSDLHQLGRIGISIVSSDAKTVENVLRAIEEFVEATADATMTGWTQDMLDFDDQIPFAVEGVDWE